VQFPAEQWEGKNSYHLEEMPSSTETEKNSVNALRNFSSSSDSQTSNSVSPVKGPVSFILADHFPLIRKDCKEKATIFLDCFTQETKQKSYMDPLIEERVSKCLPLMKEYDECIKKILEKENMQ